MRGLGLPSRRRPPPDLTSFPRKRDRVLLSLCSVRSDSWNRVLSSIASFPRKRESSFCFRSTRSDYLRATSPQSSRHSRESGNPFLSCSCCCVWHQAQSFRSSCGGAGDFLCWCKESHQRNTFRSEHPLDRHERCRLIEHIPRTTRPGAPDACLIWLLLIVVSSKAKQSGCKRDRVSAPRAAAPTRSDAASAAHSRRRAHRRCRCRATAARSRSPRRRGRVRWCRCGLPA